MIVRDGQRGRALRDLIEQWGARVVTVTADQHDRVAAAAQALTHAAVIAFGAALAELDVDIADLDRMGPPPHTALLSLLARIASGAPEVYWDVQAANPYAPAARRALSRGVSQLTDVVEDGNSAAFGDLLDRLCGVLRAPAGRLSRTQRARAAGHDHQSHNQSREGDTRMTELWKHTRRSPPGPTGSRPASARPRTRSIGPSRRA